MAQDARDGTEIAIAEADGDHPGGRDPMPRTDRPEPSASSSSSPVLSPSPASSSSASIDPLDIFDTSLAAIFSVPPISFSTYSPSFLHTYVPPSSAAPPLSAPIELRLAEPPANLTSLQANYLWLAGVYLADLLSLGEIGIGVGSRVAELGAGAGLPGVVAARRGAEVVSSDWGDPAILSTLLDNFERNVSTSTPTRTYAVVGHQWGTDPSPLLQALCTHPPQTRFDHLLLADTIWITEAHSALLDSVVALLRPGGVAHIAAGYHTGRGPVERFVSAARARGARVGSMREVQWKLGGGWEEYSGTHSGEGEERGVVVYFTLQTDTK
jgi:nicotinamide N-methyltransferase